MNRGRLLRLCGLALLVGAVLVPVGHWLQPVGSSVESMASPLWVPSQMSIWVGALFTALGLCGLYAHVAPRAGAWGLIALVLLFLSQVNLMGLTLTQMVILPPLAARDATRWVLEGGVFGMFGWAAILIVPPRTLGPLLFGALLVRVGQPWRVVGALIIGAEIFSMAMFATGESLWGARVGNSLEHVLFGWAGVLLWRESHGQATLSAPVGVTAHAS